MSIDNNFSVNDSINNIKGIGEKIEKTFHRAGVDNIGDLLKYYPRNYDIFEEPVDICNLENDRVMAVRAEVVRNLEIKKIRNLVVVNAYVRDAYGATMKLTWFNASYLKSTLQLGTVHIFRGLVSAHGPAITLKQPKIFSEKQYREKLGSMQPVYPLVNGLTNTIVSKAVKNVLDSKITIDEYIPKAILNQYNLCELNKATKGIHFPQNYRELNTARTRLVFDEFFLFVYALRKFKDSNKDCVNHHKMTIPPQISEFVQSLPYELTGAQKRTWEEIKNDMVSDKSMNRLVQGDVGSGKTIISILALFVAAFNGKQAALMAPTEVLAKQHYEEIVDIIERNNYPFKAVFLAGSTKAGEKNRIYKSMIEDDDVKIIVGTHAIFQDKVKYKNLALVITDEQHRFGVRQREAISQKGDNPHVIVMSATPIPRTLAIIMYGDLDISIIDELPANRLPIKNCVVGEEYRPNAYKFMEKQIALGRQVYVICPSVENSEAIEGENVIDYADRLKKILPPGVNVEFLHGRMKPDLKNEIMERFAKNEIQVLVSTTVVEVGVNVPNATVMMIENAERFGLAGLHQLRGRVGRGEHQSYCIFVNGSKKKDASKRLDILAKSNDGFHIANEDLKLRGPGDFFGIRQSGDMEFRLGDIYDDAKIVKMASDTVNMIYDGLISIPSEEVKTLEKAVDDYCRLNYNKISI